MADIKLEKKKKSFWPWLLVLLAAAAVIWLVADNMDTDMDTASADTDSVETENSITGEDEGNNDFVAYVNNNIDQIDMGKDHEFTSKGLNLLADELEEISGDYDNVELDGKVEELQTKADEIKNDPASTEHSDKIKSAFTAASDIITEIQKEAVPDKEQLASDVEKTADAISPGEQTLNQKEEIKAFFRAAADAVDEISNRNL